MKRALAAMLLASAAFAQGAAPASYTVVRGDTAWAVARKYGLSVDALLRLNGLEAPDLKVGQVLKVGDTDERVAVATTPPPVAASVAAAFAQAGYAVYYGGRSDAETIMTAAHLTLPIGTWVRVTHEKSGKSVLVKINDRGPFGKAERIIDLSLAAARELGILAEGVALVRLEVISR
ncbi:septal ring lytic transglycosylase RlpA family protein [Deinococcus yavapaiensis]|uniref:Probable endolytic peptidoglycan transglycosylase RlpA n=1 Tax=Deinococcus yavapaiensis KR-236 TaxID=694435 RepID=A0A318SGA3_9DEIO|nr:septal ring lytic transglycosylase RlpA family protein [Deinococcus yavapaiensis]PYE53081.1 rare lipoprotein A [Deinococcus yavapaiensis KR-236]